MYAYQSERAPNLPFDPRGYASPEHHMYSHQVPSYEYAPRGVPSRSHPVTSRRKSYSDGSSDSDDAEAISARIMGSSDDPRELKKILKTSARRHKSAVSPQVMTKQRRDNTMNSLYEQVSSAWRAHSVEPIRLSGGSYVDRREKRRHKSKEKSVSRREKQSSRARKEKQPAKARRERLPSYADDEIPAAIDADYFNEVGVDSSPERRKSNENRTKKRRSQSEHPPLRDRRKDLAVTTSHTAIVPVNTDVRRRVQPYTKRCSERELLEDTIEEHWNPASGGKRQRLPPLDWRKGERYIRAPDGTVIGKTGFRNLVVDDTWGFSKPERKKPAKRHVGPSQESTAAEESVPVKKVRRESVQSTREERHKPKSKTTTGQSSKRSSVSSNTGERRRASKASVGSRSSVAPPALRDGEAELQQALTQALTIADPTERPLLNAFDYLEKDQDGIFCLGQHRLLHRLADRKWGERHEEGGFRLCPSIATEDAFICEIALEPNTAGSRAPETLGPTQAIYGRVLRAAPNSVRLQVVGQADERLCEEDEFYIDAGSTYLLTNLSSERTAVLSLTAFE